MSLIHKSKLLSLILRHNPQKFGITLDDKGWADLSNLISNIKEITIQDIKDIINNFDKKRFELDIENNRIRAYYGHSVKQVIKKDIVQPPPILYHATSQISYTAIIKCGLKTMKRQYVHLTVDIKTALKNGKRKDTNPVLLEIRARDAFNDGIKFYLGNEDIWLSEDIPEKYLKKVEYSV